MTEPEEDWPDGEYVLVYGDEEWLMWAGDVKSAAYQRWLEKVRRAGRTQ